MRTHTPGPWRHQDGNTYFDKLGHTIVGDMIYGPAGEWIATVWQQHGSKISEQKYNACLFAAAPDLLAACELCEELLTRYAPHPESNGGAALLALRGVIAKARGLLP